MEINAIVKNAELVVGWSFSAKEYDFRTIKHLGDRFKENLTSIITWCMDKKGRGKVYTPSDYGLQNDITHKELEEFLNDRNIGMEDIMSF